ncbi:hypothetical protein ABB02_02101 [Clostridiaceae bacterium JG1575]|nr:hypothetical protein ABB02_02101 [Clostridiaceae bacterium JG1575]
MILTARQLKDKIRNLSREKSTDAQTLMRIYMMERFLERVSLSDYKNHFILKGGALIASLVGIDFRSTMDIDTTIHGLTVSEADVEQMVLDIIGIPWTDGVLFRITKIQSIMDEAEYPGIRVNLQALFDKTVTSLKLDVSTGDVITPGAIHYQYKLMFENRHITLLSYNLETVLAEKLETIVRRHVANTRMRDFYDIYMLTKIYGTEISHEVLHAALQATSRRRGSIEPLKLAHTALDEIGRSDEMEKLWTSYQAHYDYAKSIIWSDVMTAVQSVYPGIENPF